jgi:hypothetical protein
VAVPPKVFPEIVTAVVLQVLPLLLDKVTVGGLIQPHVTVKGSPTFVHPAAFVTDKEWGPLLTKLKTGLA